MEFDFGAMIGLIGIVSIALVLGLSYIGAFMMGRARGRREIELELRDGARSYGGVDSGDRLVMIESAVTSMAQAVERLTDAQRVALLEQLRAANQEPRSRRLSGHNTPA